MKMSVPAVPRRNFIKLSLGALAGSAMATGAVTANADLSGWQQALEREAVWLRQAADGCWHCGARDLSALTHSLLRALEPGARVQAGGAQISFTQGGRKHRVVLHFIA